MWYRQVSGSGKLRQAGGSQEKQRASEMCLPAVENKNGGFFFSWMEVIYSIENLHVILVKGLRF